MPIYLHQQLEAGGFLMVRESHTRPGNLNLFSSGDVSLNEEEARSLLMCLFRWKSMEEPNRGPETVQEVTPCLRCGSREWNRAALNKENPWCSECAQDQTWNENAPSQEGRGSEGGSRV